MHLSRGAFLALALVAAVALHASAAPKVIAHRGASGDAPENTLAAFRKAVEARADWFELDCRLSKDNAVVICHDADLERTAGRKVAVADLTLAEIQALDAGAWFSAAFAGERIPTLAQSLDVATPACGVYVEIKSEAGDGAVSAKLVAHAKGKKRFSKSVRKELLAIADSGATRSPALTRACIEEIRAKKMEKRVVIQSFSPLVCFIAHCEAPEIRTELLLSDDKDDPAHFLRLADFALFIGLPGINCSKDSLTPGRLAMFKSEHKSVAVWTVNEKEDMLRFAAMGVDAIITNYPQTCGEMLRGGK